MKNIVTLVDFSDATPKLITVTQSLATALKARVTLLHAVPKVPVLLDVGIVAPTVLETASPARIEEDYSRLTEWRTMLAEAGVSVSVHQVEEGGVEGLFSVLDGLAADMILVGAHPHGALYQGLIGTCTTEVLRRAHCPVLVVPV